MATVVAAAAAAVEMAVGLERIVIPCPWAGSVVLLVVYAVDVERAIFRETK